MPTTLALAQNWKLFVGDLHPRTPAEGWGGAKAHAYDFGAVAQSLDDSRWTDVEVPHDFVVQNQYTRRPAGTDLQKIPAMESIDSRHFAAGSLESGVAWYRLRFTAPAGDDTTRARLCFEGVYRDCTVYLNEYYVGRHIGGYDAFAFDVSDFLHPNAENVLAVRVDATGREGWWYEGGGIYRPVTLELRDAVGLAPDGVFAHAQVNAAARTATVQVETTLDNHRFAPCDAALTTELLDPAGRIVAAAEQNIALGVWQQQTLRQEFALQDVQLWDLDTPQCYRVRNTVAVGGIVTDRTETSFGLRETRWDADHGFFLNGRPIKIKGVCCHHDHAAGGIAEDPTITEFRLRQLQSMGANAYRSAHHMPSQALLTLCDRLGLLVFAETRRMSSCADDLQALCSLVKAGRNHPSVFLWGIGNEEVFAQDQPEAARVTRTMVQTVRALDPTRPVTAAVVCWNSRERYPNAAPFLHGTQYLDVMGFNYGPGAWDDYHARMPQQPMIVTEAATNSGTRGCAETCEDAGQYCVWDPDNAEKVRSGPKAVRAHKGEDQWERCAARDYLAGLFVWTGFDYRGEPTPLGWPAVYSQFGICDYCGFEKDNFYYYQSAWGDQPVVHLFPHWNWAGRESQPMTLRCHTNCDEVELWVNGQSQGRRRLEAENVVCWEGIPYAPGTVEAKGYQNGQCVATDRIETTGPAAGLSAEVFAPQTGEPVHTVLVNLRVVDAAGRTVPTADPLLHFALEGCTLRGTGNGDPADHSAENLPLRRAFSGRAQLAVRVREGTPAVVQIRSAGLSTVTVTL